MNVYAIINGINALCAFVIICLILIRKPTKAVHLTEPFYTAGSDGGSGLGLAIVYNIIKEHGGAITVQSEPGCFTQFDIRLKAA